MDLRGDDAPALAEGPSVDYRGPVVRLRRLALGGGDLGFGFRRRNGFGATDATGGAGEAVEADGVLAAARDAAIFSRSISKVSGFGWRLPCSHFCNVTSVTPQTLTA